MGIRILPAALVVLSAATLLAGCQEPSRPGEVHGRYVQPAATEGPYCEHHPYGEVKSGDIQRSVVAVASEPVAIASDDHPADAGKLLILDHPLESLPPEIARIRRGVVKRFTGKFVKDGVMTWSGLDLERLVAVSVERRVFDFREHYSRPVPDPRFTTVEQLSFARKWTNGQRTEVEVVAVFPVTLVEAQLFVCAANPAWASKEPLGGDDTDEMSAGVTDVFLLDRRQASGLVYSFNKPVDMTEGLSAVLGSIWQHAPRGPAW
ncbi:MAG TPA: hypothetical protein VHB68_12980 [Steroidobacteraceae bacterium]|nr:hypothetical protein [Steroidobacteraceae bacterium]